MIDFAQPDYRVKEGCLKLWLSFPQKCGTMHINSEYAKYLFLLLIFILNYFNNKNMR